MPSRKPKTSPQKRPTGPLITELEMAFCHYLLGADSKGNRRTPEECAVLAGLPAEDAKLLAMSARVRDYCDQYTSELARQMARQEAMRRADYELSPMAIAGELFFLLKHGQDERARVAAGAKLLDWLGPLDDRMKRATTEDLRYFAEHGHWPEERLLRAPAGPWRPDTAQAPVVVDQVAQPAQTVSQTVSQNRYDF
jgi:hypothetical protein